MDVCKMKLSIIISVYKSYEIVRRQLLHFRSIDLPFELIIVDDGSNPSIKEATMQTNNNQMAWTQGLGRNKGVESASGEYIFLTDIDHIISKEALEDALNYTGKRMMFRRQAAILDHFGKIDQSEEALNEWEFVNPRRPGKLDCSVHGNTFVMPRQDFLDLGGYDKKVCTRGHYAGRRRGDDCNFNKRWGRAYAGTIIDIGRDIFMFPTGRFNRSCNHNPFGLFNELPHTQEIVRKNATT